MPRKNRLRSKPVLSDHLCECDCGARTFIAQSTNKARGAVKGMPNRFRAGHQHRKYKLGKYYFHDRSYVPGKKSAS